MWINKWDANTVHSSVTSVQLQRICYLKKYKFSAAVLNTDSLPPPPPQNGAWFLWNDLKSFPVPRQYQRAPLMKHSDVLSPAITFSRDSRSHSSVHLSLFTPRRQASQVGSVVKNPPANAGDARDVTSIPESGRSPGVGNGNPLQYSCLENPMDREVGGIQYTGSRRVGHGWAHTHPVRSPEIIHLGILA